MKRTNNKKKKLPSPLPESGIFTTIEAAQYVRMSYQWLELARTRGGGPAYAKLGKAVRYRRVDLDQWLAERIIRNTAQAPSAER